MTHCLLTRLGINNLIQVTAVLYSYCITCSVETLLLRVIYYSERVIYAAFYNRIKFQKFYLGLFLKYMFQPVFVQYIFNTINKT